MSEAAKKSAPDANDLHVRGEPLRLVGVPLTLPEDEPANVDEGTAASTSWLVDHWRPMSAIGPDWLDVEPPPRQWLLKRGTAPVLSRRIVSLLVAPGGRGKTYALVGLALAVATGRPWLDTFDVAHAGKVILALAEEEIDEVRRRLHGIARSMALSDAERRLALERIVPLGLVGRTVALVDVVGTAVQPSALHGAILELVGAEDHALIILDPLSRWAPHVEADNATATAAITALEELAQASGATVVVAHHTAKWANREGNKAGNSAARGVTGLVDAVRWVGGLDGATEDDLRFIVSKSNYAPHGEPVPLVRDPSTGALRPPTSVDLDAARVKAAAELTKRFASLQEAVLDAVRAEPGIGRAGLRKAVRAAVAAVGRGGVDNSAVDKATDNLIEEGRLENRREGQRFHYHLAAGGEWT